VSFNRDRQDGNDRKPRIWFCEARVAKSYGSAVLDCVSIRLLIFSETCARLRRRNSGGRPGCAQRPRLPRLSVLKMVIKLVVGELGELTAYRKIPYPKNGFHRFMLVLAWHIDDATGELDIEREDINRLGRYARSGYKRKVLAVFGRTLGQWF
jgi:hypothetical protein